MGKVLFLVLQLEAAPYSERAGRALMLQHKMHCISLRLYAITHVITTTALPKRLLEQNDVYPNELPPGHCRSDSSPALPPPPVSSRQLGPNSFPAARVCPSPSCTSCRPATARWLHCPCRTAAGKASPLSLLRTPTATPASRVGVGARGGSNPHSPTPTHGLSASSSTCSAVPAAREAR